MQTNTDRASAYLDTLPPHDIAAEAGALGSVLTAGDAEQLFDRLSPDHFCDHRHQTVFASLNSLRAAGRPLDVVCTVQHLRDNGKLEAAGGLEYVTGLPDATPSPLVFGTWLETIDDRRKRRRDVALADELARAANDPSQPYTATEDIVRKIWESHLDAGAKSDEAAMDELLSYDPQTDGQTVLGNRWLCRGGTALLIGQSGIGKSSLAVQAAVFWAAGLSFLGVKPSRPLKIVLVQAENDRGDMAEMYQGAFTRMPFEGEAEQLSRQNLVTVCNTTHAGQRFATELRRLVSKYNPDLVIADPLQSYFGDDIAQNRACSQFLRLWIGPILKSTGTVLIFVHHMGKPSADPKSRKHWQASDRSYSGLGGSELTNWARAIMVLENAGHGAFRLEFTKRGKRAEATHPNGQPTQTVWLRHSSDCLFWEQLAEPEAPPEEKGPGKPNPKTPDDMLRLIPLTGKIFKPELLTKALNAGFSERNHRPTLAILIESKRAILTAEPRPGTRPAEYISRPKADHQSELDQTLNRDI